MKYKVTKHKGYSIREQDHRIGNEIVCSTFSVYDDEGEFLHRAKTLDAAKDWIDELALRSAPLMQGVPRVPSEEGE